MGLHSNLSVLLAKDAVGRHGKGERSESITAGEVEFSTNSVCALMCLAINSRE